MEKNYNINDILKGLENADTSELYNNNNILYNNSIIEF